MVQRHECFYKHDCRFNVVTIILAAKMIIKVFSVVKVFNHVIMFFQGTASPVGYGERVEMARRFDISVI